MKLYSVQHDSAGCCGRLRRCVASPHPVTGSIPVGEHQCDSSPRGRFKLARYDDGAIENVNERPSCSKAVWMLVRLDSESNLVWTRNGSLVLMV